MTESPVTTSFLKSVPHSPGVYLMKDRAGKIIYAGKARDLRNRLSSYRSGESQRFSKTAVMLQKVAEIETILTATEKEALILEASLIKKHKPRYNVILRDDKNYPYIKVTVSEEEDLFIAQTEKVFKKQEIDQQWAEETVSYVLEKISEEALSRHSSQTDNEVLGAKLISLGCRRTICEMEVQSDNMSEMIRYFDIVRERLASKLPVTRFGTPIPSGAGYRAKIYLATDRASFN